MREFPRSLYFSASWRDTDRKLTLSIARTFASKGFLLVRDHPYYRDHAHERHLDYSARLSEILDDCCGIVVLWPKRDSPQTTSPYMFPEPLYASKSGLPIFILYTDGVALNLDQTGGNTVLAFGSPSGSGKALDVNKLENEGFSDPLVESTFRIDLKKPASLIGPIKVPANPDQYPKKEERIAEAVQRFADSLPLPRRQKFVFNIIPFAMQREHRVIARAVLEQTGLPCFTAEDHRDSEEDVAERWKRYLGDSTLVIADLSTPRETCSLEVGLAIGKGRPVFIVSRREAKEIPYGANLRPVKSYRSHRQLAEAVRMFCAPYRRRVINTEFIEESSAAPGVTGLPSWYFRKPWLDISSMLFAFSVFVSVGAAAFLAAVVRQAAPQQPLAPVLAGTLFAVFGIAVSAFGPLQQHLEKWVAERIRVCLAAALLFALIGGLVLWQVI